MFKNTYEFLSRCSPRTNDSLVAIQLLFACLKPTMETPEHSEMLLKLTFTFIVKWELMSFWCL